MFCTLHTRNPENGHVFFFYVLREYFISPFHKTLKEDETENVMCRFSESPVCRRKIWETIEILKFAVQANRGQSLESCNFFSSEGYRPNFLEKYGDDWPMCNVLMHIFPLQKKTKTSLKRWSLWTKSSLTCSIKMRKKLPTILPFTFGTSIVVSSHCLVLTCRFKSLTWWLLR